MLTRRDALLGALAVTGARPSFAKASQPSARLTFEVPPHACDCHTHLFGDPKKFPYWPSRAYTPETAPAIAEQVRSFLAFVKSTLGDAVAEVRASDRLTDSAVCLVAPETGPDRALERVLAGAGRLKTASKPILEVNPRHDLVVALAALGEREQSFKEDAARLLFDEARLRDGERPVDARSFSDRLARVLERGLRQTPA